MCPGRSARCLRALRPEYRRAESHARVATVAPGVPVTGTFTPSTARQTRLPWQHKTPYRIGRRRRLDGNPPAACCFVATRCNFLAIDGRTGEILWKFQTGFGADAPPVVYEVDGVEYIAIFTGGNSIQQSATGDAVWAFSLRASWGQHGRQPRHQRIPASGSNWRLRSALLSLWEGGGYHKRIGETERAGCSRRSRDR